ncbi:MAG: hypothetical protein ABJ242_08875 [Marinomonas sp.]
MISNKSIKLLGSAHLAIMITTLAGGAICAPVNAQTQQQDAQKPPINISYDRMVPLLKPLRKGAVREQYISQVVGPLRVADREGDGLIKADVEMGKTISETLSRAKRIGDFLRYDYNGDWKLYVDEIVQFSSATNLDDARKRAERTMARFDNNGDGIATLEEANMKPKRQRPFQVDRLSSLMGLDSDGDGRVIASELVTLAEKTFDHFDSNGDGSIDKAEHGEVSKVERIATRSAEVRQAGCTFPPASRKAELVFLRADYAKRVSAAFVGSEEKVTSVVDVTIEPGKKPIYLVLGSSSPMVWRVTGATKRIEKAIIGSKDSVNRLLPSDKYAQSATSAAGLIGLPKEKVSIVGPDCLSQHFARSSFDRMNADIVSQIIAKRPAGVFASIENAFDIAVPSALSPKKANTDPYPPPPAPASSGYVSKRWQYITSDDHNYLVDIDPKDVVASEPVGKYAVSPEHYGIAQMIDEGILQPDAKSRLVVLQNVEAWPAGLRGSRAVTFVISDDVKVPEKKLKSSCVLTTAEASQANWRSACRQQIRERRRR